MSRQVNVGQIVPNIQVGDTITLPPNASATVTNIGTELNPILQFSIPKGDAGAIKMLIVAELPSTGANDTIYLVPAEDTETGNNYDEYVYVNNAWEKLGGIQVQVNLKDYVKDTDYATSSKGGVIKVNSGVASAVDGGGTFYASPRTYQDYLSGANTMFIGKGTLENVITGKELVNKTYVDNIVGDIESLLAEV